MPAMPAPSTRTEVPGGGWDSLMGPVKVEPSAYPSSVIAWYMAALPATTPIMLRRERRLGALVWSVIVFPVTLHCLGQRLVGVSVPEVPQKHLFSVPVHAILVRAAS